MLVIVVGALAAISLIIGIVGLKKASGAATAVEALPGLESRLTSAEQKANRGEQAAQMVGNIKGTLDRSLDMQATDMAAVRTKLNNTELALKEIVTKIGELESRGGSRGGSSAASAGGSGGPSGPAPGTLSEDGSYIVKSGDTFGKIAAACGVTVADIQNANPGVDARRLRVGQKISVPKK